MVRKELQQIFVISLAVEVGTSLWRWLRAPTDGLHVEYNFSFLAYEAERIVPWAVFFVLMILLWLFLGRIASARNLTPK